MKILYFNPVGTIGGAEMCLLDVLAMVGAARPDWRLSVVLGDDGPLRAAVEALGVPCALLPLPRGVARMGDAGGGQEGGWSRGGALAVRGSTAALATGAYLARLRRLLRREAPDQVQTNGMKAHVLAAWAAASARRVPIVWHLHEYLGTRPVMARLLRGSAGRGVAAVAVSRSVADDAARVLGGRVPVRTIYNAIDLDRFAPEEAAPEFDSGAWLDAAAGLAPAAPGTVRVGLVATFAVWKGHGVFLDAAARVAAERPCRFYVVGGPIYRSRGSQVSLEDLQARAEALGLTGRVGFVGHQADPARAIRALDVVVHASTRPEPFGRVIVEAMACSRALVAIRDGGAAELFDDETNALGCPPSDPAALAHAIDRLITDPALRRRLGHAGHATALARFDRRRLAEQWISVYSGGAVGRAK